MSEQKEYYVMLDARINWKRRLARVMMIFGGTTMVLNGLLALITVPLTHGPNWQLILAGLGALLLVAGIALHLSAPAQEEEKGDG